MNLPALVIDRLREFDPDMLAHSKHAIKKTLSLPLLVTFLEFQVGPKDGL